MKQLLFVVMAIFFFTGCTEVKDQTKHKLPTYMEEFNDFSSKIAIYSNFKKETPKHYRLTATIELQREPDADRMLYEIAIRKPTIEMKNVKMTFGLHPKMLQHLLTSNVFNTTDENTPLHLIPDKEPFGLTLGRGHIIDKSSSIVKCFLFIVTCSLKSHTNRTESRLLTTCRRREKSRRN